MKKNYHDSSKPRGL